jgi:hypothetical protein
VTELLLPDLAGKDAWVWAPLAEQLHAFAVQHFDELDPEAHTREILARAVWGDPLLRLYACVDHGQVVGFGCATIERHGPSVWVYSLAGEIHGDDGTTVERYHQSLEAWGRQHGAKQILHATDRHAPAWTRKYHFVSRRMVMARMIPPA